MRDGIDEPSSASTARSGEPQSFDALDRLLDAQAYRLAYWRVAVDEINYRRFFDVNDLAALRMNEPKVFEQTHALIFELVDEGKIDGLRIDHSDGLFDPQQYFERLQERFRRAASGESRCTSSPKKFSRRTNACRSNGRCTARRAMTSRRLRMAGS